MKTKLIILALGALFALPFAASAQSKSELEAAKSLAKSYGYSESEIESILSSQMGEKESSTAESVTVTTIQQPVSTATVVHPAEESEEREKSLIYGHEFFASKGLSVIPSLNTPAPVGYILGPGDEITIDIWGNTNAKINSVIAKDGSVMLSGVGPVHIAGLTAKKAETALKSKLAKIYGDIGGATKLKLTINRVRAVTVSVVGDVLIPGAYALPALAQIPSALYMAGGVEETASVRDIKLYRAGEQVATFDFYEFMFKGVYDENIKLEDNDIISVPSYRALVNVTGEAKRPMLYEIKDGETVEDIITYAGGFADNAATDMVYLERKTPKGIDSYQVAEDEFKSFRLTNGDLVNFNACMPDVSNRVCAQGALRKPGFYAISAGMDDVKALIEAAGGLSEGAYKDRATIFRKDKDLNPVSINFDISEVLSGIKVIPLNRDDSLHVYEAAALRDSLTVHVYGAVKIAGIYNFRDGMTVSDIIMEAGGLVDGASLSNVEIARKGRTDKGFVKQLDLQAHPELAGELLKSGDAVFVRSEINFREPKTIYVQGEVSYPGTYAVDRPIVRLSDVIERAGGFTTDAYVKGATLARWTTDIERNRMENAAMLATQQLQDKMEVLDSLNLFGRDYYNIGIDLDKAVNNPGSEADVILQTGDIITIPVMNNTVKISGAVFYPNTVAYNPSYTWRDYISQAGGLKKGAKSRKIYAVYMNGQVAKRGSSNFKMEPGMELVVATEKTEDRKLSATELATISSSAISIAYMVTALVRMFDN